MCSCRATVLLGSHRYGGMAPTAGVLQWAETSLLEGTVRKQVIRNPGGSWSVNSSFLTQRMEEPLRRGALLEGEVNEHLAHVAVQSAQQHALGLQKRNAQNKTEKSLPLSCYWHF